MSKILFFESKSQLVSKCIFSPLGCFLCQRYFFLKANHNLLLLLTLLFRVVSYVKDTFFWKQITTALITCSAWYLLFLMSKILFFESKSQLPPPPPPAYIVVSYVKDTFFWKQITTTCWSTSISNRCFLCQRYFFLKANHNRFVSCKVCVSVVSYVKDTFFWKQITTEYVT